MKYTKYSYFTDVLTSGINKAESLTGVNKLTSDQAMRHVISARPDFLVNEINGYFLCHEHDWKNSNRTIVFPEDSALLDNLANSRFNIVQPDAITPFADSFILNFPKDYELGGFKTTSVLFTYCKGPVTVEKYITPLLKHLGLEDIEQFVVKDETSESASLRLFYRRYDEDAKDVANHMLLVPWNYLTEVLNSKNSAEYKDKLGTLGEELSIPNTEEDSEFEFLMLKLVISLFVYVQANSQALVNGFPGQSMPNQNGLHFKLPNIESMTLKNPVKGSSDKQQGEHYRSWHYRQLVDDRYYQGQWKDAEKGSRIVFVNDSYVGGDVDAKTVVKTKKR